MNVTLIRSRRFHGGNGARGDGDVPERLQFLAGAALTLLAPTLFYCVVSGEWWPLLLMAVNGGLGIALGLALYAKTPARHPACVPKTRAARVSEGAGQVKKAA